MSLLLGDGTVFIGGIRTAEGLFFFLVLGIFVAPLWYKEDTWLDNLILLLMAPREVNITLSIDAILTRSGPSCTLAPLTFCFFSVH